MALVNVWFSLTARLRASRPGWSRFGNGPAIRTIPLTPRCPILPGRRAALSSLPCEPGGDSRDVQAGPGQQESGRLLVPGEHCQQEVAGIDLPQGIQPRQLDRGFNHLLEGSRDDGVFPRTCPPVQEWQGTLEHLGQSVGVSSQFHHTSSDQVGLLEQRTEHLLRSQQRSCFRGTPGASLQNETGFFFEGGPDGGHRCGLLPGSPGRVRALGASLLSFPRPASGSCVASAPEEGPSRGGLSTSERDLPPKICGIAPDSRRKPRNPDGRGALDLPPSQHLRAA